MTIGLNPIPNEFQFVGLISGICSTGVCQYNFNSNMYLECKAWSIVRTWIVLCGQCFTVYLPSLKTWQVSQIHCFGKMNIKQINIFS